MGYNQDKEQDNLGGLVLFFSEYFITCQGTTTLFSLGISQCQGSMKISILITDRVSLLDHYN